MCPVPSESRRCARRARAAALLTRFRPNPQMLRPTDAAPGAPQRATKNRRCFSICLASLDCLLLGPMLKVSHRKTRWKALLERLSIDGNTDIFRFSCRTAANLTYTCPCAAHDPSNAVLQALPELDLPRELQQPVTSRSTEPCARRLNLRLSTCWIPRILLTYCTCLVSLQLSESRWLRQRLRHQVGTNVLLAAHVQAIVLASQVGNKAGLRLFRLFSDFDVCRGRLLSGLPALFSVQTL